MRFSSAAIALLAAFALLLPIAQGQGSCFIAYPVANNEGELWERVKTTGSAITFEGVRIAAIFRSTSQGDSLTTSSPDWTGCTTWVRNNPEITNNQELSSWAMENLQACKLEEFTPSFCHFEPTATSLWTVVSNFSNSRTMFTYMLSAKVSLTGISSLQDGLPIGNGASATMSLEVYSAIHAGIYAGSRHTDLIVRAYNVVVKSCDEIERYNELKRTTRAVPDETGPSSSTPLPEPVAQPLAAPLDATTPQTPQTVQPTASPIAPTASPTTSPIATSTPTTTPQAAPQATPTPQSPPTAAPVPTASSVPHATPTASAPITPIAPTPVSVGSCLFEGGAMQQTFDLQSAYYGSSGQGLRVSPFRAPQTIDQNIVVDLTVRGIHEVSRSTPGCGEPGVAFLANTELNSAVRSLNLSYCDCFNTRRTVEAVPGVMEDQFVVTFDCSRVDGLYKDFKMDLIYKNPHQSYSLHFPPTRETINQGFGYNYTANSTSFGIEIENWPWHEKYLTKRTYVVLDFLFTVHLLNTSCTLGYAKNQTGSLFDLTTSESYIGVFADRGYAINGIPYVGRVVGEVPFSSYDLPHGPLDDLTAMRHQFCTEVNYEANNWTSIVKWQNASYDPSFTAFFFGTTPGNKALTPKQAKDRKTTAIAAGVVVGLIVVVTASLGVLIFAWRNHRDREASRLTANLSS